MKVKLEELSDVEYECAHLYFQLVGEFDVVVNATGYSSKFLCNDDRLEPSRGQMLRVSLCCQFFYSR